MILYTELRQRGFDELSRADNYGIVGGTVVEWVIRSRINRTNIPSAYRIAASDISVAYYWRTTFINISFYMPFISAS